MQDKTGRDCEDQIRVCVCAGRAHELCEGDLLRSRTLPEEAVIPVQGVAAPAVLAELVLALHRPLSHAQANGTHHIWVSVAQLLLVPTRPGTLSHITLDGATGSSHVPRKDQLERVLNSKAGRVFPQSGKSSKQYFIYEFFIL